MFKYLVGVYRSELAKCPHKNPLRVWVEEIENNTDTTTLFSEVGTCVGSHPAGSFGLPRDLGRHTVKRWIEIPR